MHCSHIVLLLFVNVCVCVCVCVSNHRRQVKGVCYPNVRCRTHGGGLSPCLMGPHSTLKLYESYQNKHGVVHRGWQGCQRME